ncbi:MAG TPA: hypothetical protein VNM39_09455 [Verrucomicrobiae bacterium]|nr:hypothetical protein [Verrucomicrobiae bacterium]
MKQPIVHRLAALASLAACLVWVRPARAAVPGTQAEAAESAVADTSRLLPHWLHLHAAAGLGWLASPEWMRKFYQAGQGYELGFEVRPSNTFRLRLNGEYQGLPVVTDAKYTYVYMAPGGVPIRDTLVVEERSNGWIGSARLEANWSLAPQLWVLGGLGRGYLETGLQSQHPSGVYSSSFIIDFPGSSGWTWDATVGTSYEFALFGPRLSAEVRTNYLMRNRDRMQTWSIRLGWGGD